MNHWRYPSRYFEAGGTKVSIATTIDECFVVGMLRIPMRALSGSPYDGHTLAEALAQVGILTERKPKLAVVDRGYRGTAWRRPEC